MYDKMEDLTNDIHLLEAINNQNDKIILSKVKNIDKL